MMLSEHFSLEELTASEVAARAGIDNTPSPEAMGNLLRLAEGLELVRAALGNNPIHVTSGYRSPRLNQMVGGAKNSMHMQGLAADILCPSFGPPLEVCRAIATSGDPVRSSHSRVRPVVPRRLRARGAHRPQPIAHHRKSRHRLRAGFARRVARP